MRGKITEIVSYYCENLDIMDIISNIRHWQLRRQNVENIFITKLHIKKVRHLENMEIELSDTERRHLILTGKNGSGKTSLLLALTGSVAKSQLKSQPGSLVERINFLTPYHKIPKELAINVSYHGNMKNLVFVYIPARRVEFELPKIMERIEIDHKTVITRNASKDFLKYILSLDYQLYGAQRNNNTETEVSLHHWFDNLKATLRNIFDAPHLELRSDTKNFSFIIEIPGREPFALHEMSDGYAAFLDIYMELIMRFETDGTVVDYNKSAIVLIDEVEAHLHVELQKRILPFLTQMFPNVQFIVSTHSPFVISSSSNAVVYDLENKRYLENPSAYSYETIVEAYLDVGQYSEEMKNTFNKYRELYDKELTGAEAVEFQQLVSALKLVPPASKELYLAFRTMEDKRQK